jgi:hypothetical protein
MLFTSILLSIAAQAVIPACPTANIANDASIGVVGAFSNMRYTEEHAYGYTVDLWRASDCLFGFLLASEGLAGDTPTGLLEQVQYNEKTGALSFRARLTAGLFSDRERQNVPSRDQFEFSGTLAGGTLRGTLRRTNALTPQAAPIVESVVLRASREEAQSMITATKFGEWRQRAAEILQRRGPKW